MVTVIFFLLSWSLLRASYHNSIAGDGFKSADFIAGSTLNAFGRVQVVRFGTWSANCSRGTYPHARLASSAFFLNDTVFDQVLTHRSPAPAVFYVFKVFIPKYLSVVRTGFGAV